MKANILVEQVLRESRNRLTGKVKADAFEVLELVNEEIETLVNSGDFEWAKRYLDPAIRTSPGETTYPLPDGFPENFCLGGGESGQDFVCKLNDGNQEKPLTWQSQEQYFVQDFASVTDSTPTKYTITTDAAGRKELRLYPPPDANGETGYYEVSGLFQPVVWKIADLDEEIPVPGPYLRNAVLFRLTGDQKYALMAAGDLRVMRYQRAKSRRTSLKPKLSSTGTGNEYTQMRRY